MKLIIVLFILIYPVIVLPHGFVGMEMSKAARMINKNIASFKDDFYTSDSYTSEVSDELLTVFNKEYGGTMYCESNKTKYLRYRFVLTKDKVVISFYSKDKVIWNGIFEKKKVMSKDMSSFKLLFLNNAISTIKIAIFHNKDSTWRIGSFWFNKAEEVCAVQATLGKPITF